MCLYRADLTTASCSAGERISPLQAEIYLDALDFDHDGVVDFADVLSWAAVMKMNYEPADVSPTAHLARTLLRIIARTSVHHVFMLVMVGAVARDLFVAQRNRLVRVKALRIVGYLSALFFVAKLARQATLWRWTSFTSVLSAMKARLLRK